MPLQTSGPDWPLSPAAEALVDLWAIEDAVGDHDTALIRRPDSTVVLVGSIDAWEAWSLALCRRRYPVEQHIGDHVQVTHTLIGTWPVTVLHGSMDELAPAIPLEAAA